MVSMVLVSFLFGNWMFIGIMLVLVDYFESDFIGFGVINDW